ncbi:MarR family transcriptional regulator [Novosphingobium sp. BL-52-GroH]|uniref:MarR family transcriptional regulator n=1 Tax=Novosphingobium sp. BL-52-GroH TaxID=3349877 RepID=UPI00384FD7BE
MTDPITSARRLDMCRKLIAMRRAAHQLLGETFSPAPCLDMLADLYTAQSEGREVYIWALCMAAHTPFSTAHRKVGDLEKQGLVVRRSGDGDRRRIGIEMTAAGNTTLDALLDSFIVILNPRAV